MKSLTIIDINTIDLSICVNDSCIIQLDRGTISTKNCQKINLKNYDNKLVELKIFNKLFNELKKFKKLSFFETDIANLRNDKNLYISKIINILKIKIYLKKFSFKKIKLISENSETIESIKCIFPDVEIILKNKKKNYNNSIIFYIIKFYIKSFFFILFIKIFSQSTLINKSLIKFNECYLSIFPNFYERYKEKFFSKKKEKKFFLNFLITDETHLNSNFFELLQSYYHIKNKLICLESFIHFKDILTSFQNSFNFYETYKRHSSKFYFVENVNLTKFFKKSFDISIINRSKLFLTSAGMSRFLAKAKPTKFHLYLFEYSFGFFLTRIIKSQNIKVLGYQHGIFSKKLYWTNIIIKLKSKLFFPDLIISNCKKSLKDYKLIFKDYVKKIIFKNKNISHLAKRINICSNSNLNKVKKILILSGTHDIKDIISFCQIEYIKNKNNIFFIKTHPKNKYIFHNTENIRNIKNTKIKNFDTVIISPTSTIMYDFDFLKKKYSIFNSEYKYC
jgi:hypothetical protein